MKTEIRLAQLDDAARIQAVYAPYCESSNVTFEAIAPTRDEMAERISRIMSTYPWLVAETEGRLTGYAYASRFRERAAYRWTAEVAVYVAHDEQQRGLGRALYTSLFSILRAQGYVKAIAGITLPNPASIRLHEKMGFQKVGSFPGIGYKGDRWLDVGWWQLTLLPETSGPPEPHPFPSIDNDAVVAALDAGRRLANRSI